MKAIDIVGQRVYISNQEDKLVRYIIAHNAPNFNKLSDRYKEVAYSLYKKNTILIADNGSMKVNFSQDLSEMI